jgi:hypothetical protein
MQIKGKNEKKSSGRKEVRRCKILLGGCRIRSNREKGNAFR